MQGLARLLAVQGVEERSRYRVGDDAYWLMSQQGALLGHALQPMTAGHEVDAPSAIKLLLLVEDAGREVVLLLAIDHGAVAALALKGRTAAGMVTDACAGPHIVHGPYNRFARVKDFADSFE